MTVHNKAIKHILSDMAVLLCVVVTSCFCLSACGREQEPAAVLADGVYSVDFQTDSGMFHVSEACDGKGTLTVKDGRMTLHISLASKNIVCLYPGTAEDAQKEGAALLQPTLDTVTYSDGITEEVYGFDVPLPVLEEEFDLALLGTKGKWYDHRVSVSNPVLTGNDGQAEDSAAGRLPSDLADGEYTVEVFLAGGSGRAKIISPAVLMVENGKAVVRIAWNSPYYDYMVVAEERIEPIKTGEHSTFEFPLEAFDKPIAVIADTTAMSKPYEIAYTLTFSESSLKKKAQVFAGDKETDGSGAQLGDGLEMELDYAEGFSLTRYDSGYELIALSDGSRFLLIPEDKDVPVNLDEGMIPLKRPVDTIYLAATAAMDMFVSLGSLDLISLSGTQENRWCMEEAQNAMKNGAIRYAGKYNAPDYELILDSGCSLAIESTMILHCPEVKEELEGLGIPVLIDRSSYESHPLGRTEWIKLYGALAGKEEEAIRIFEEQKELLASLSDTQDGGKTVAFFYVTSNGMVNVRKSGDYIPKMIELAGGRYLFSDLGDDGARASMNMQMEEFYAAARDADYLIYNSTTQGELLTKELLLQKSPLFADFKAFQEGNLYFVAKDFYQESTSAGKFIVDVHTMLHPEELKNGTFFYLSKME